MSRHEGVSCDSCLKGNFRGKRYKCLICYDYDLCATCYEAGATNTRHTPDHPMQCILTRSDFDLYYGGEAVSVEQPQSFTCPYCGKMGFTEAALQEHVTSEHADTSFEVVCPVCAALPGGEPNHVTDDFAAHLTLEHRSPRDLDEPSGSRHVRRIPHPGRGMSSARTRRTQMQFSSTGGLSALSPSNRESMDPIAELLSQLSGVRRTATLAQSNTSSQIQQLQMQLQFERQQAQAARQQLERLPRRQAHMTGSAASATGASNSATLGGANSVSASGHSHYTMILEPTPSPATASSSSGSQFLLSRYTEPCLSETEQQALEVDRADRSLFVQELLLTTLAEQISLCNDWDSIGKELSRSTDDGSTDIFAGSREDGVEGDLNPTYSGSSSDSVSSSSQQQRPSSFQHHQQVLPNQHTQQSRNNPNTRKSPNPSSVMRQVSRNGPAFATAQRAQQPPQNLQRDNGSQQQSGGGGLARSGTTGGTGGASLTQRVPSREGVNSGRAVSRPAGSSPSSARRKVLRHMDERNKSSEPPPPH